MSSSSDTISSLEPAASIEPFEGVLTHHKVSLADSIGTVQSSWASEQLLFAREADYPVIDQSLHLLMMIYNLTHQVEVLRNHITNLESRLDHFTDDGK